MPELAEVEYFRRLWDPGQGKRILRVHLHPKARVFRGVDTAALTKSLTGSRLVFSTARGKQMLFRFSGATMGIHLGMTGKLSATAPDFAPGKHDHLVLFHAGGALVFSDPRLFGRVRFDQGKSDPAWWTAQAADVLSPEFRSQEVADFLARRRGSPVKAILLMQERFPGIGNWMADEILWRAGLHPSLRGGDVTDPKALWKAVRVVSRDAIRIIGKDGSDPPESWLFRHRWKKGGSCPRCGSDLKHSTIGGRTTCWCPRCQPAPRTTNTRGDAQERP